MASVSGALGDPLVPEGPRPPAAAPSLSGVEDLEAESSRPVCWVCRDPDVEEPLVAPCRCSGTMRGVHASCIEAWLAARRQHRFRRQVGGAIEELCDLCGAPYSCEHQPAGNRQFVWAHAALCWQSARGSCLNRRVAATFLAVVWLVGSTIAFAELVASSWTRSWTPPADWPRRTWASAVLALCGLTFSAEAAAVALSAPWPSQAPTSPVLRAFFLDAGREPLMQVVVVMLLMHLWCSWFLALVVPLLQGPGELTIHLHPSFRVEWPPFMAWPLMLAALAPPAFPSARWLYLQLRQCRCSPRTCSSAARGAAGCCRESCSQRGCAAARGFLRVLLNPALPWLHCVNTVLLQLTMVIAAFWDSAWKWCPILAASLVGCACAAATLRAVCARGPFDAVFEVVAGGPRLHCVWVPLLTMVLYWDGVTALLWADSASDHPYYPLAWAVLMAALSAWVAQIAAVALYTNCAELRAYWRRWRTQWGQTRIVGAPVQDVAAPAAA